MARPKIRHEVELTGERQYTQGLKSMETGMKNVKASLTALNAEYGKNTKSVEGLQKRQELLTQQLGIQQQKMAAIKAEHERVAAAEGENSERAQELARDYEYARAAAMRTEKDLKTLAETTDKATSKWEQFKAKLKEGGGELDKVGKKISDAGEKWSKFLSLPIAGGFIASAKAAMTFESAVAKVDIITKGALGAENITRGLIDTSNELGTAVGNLAEAQYQAISAGIEAADSLTYTAQATKAAKAGYADVTTVVKGSTSVVNAWKMSAGEIPGMFDKLILSLDLGKAELNDLSNQLGQITGLAPQLGVSFDEVLASTAALTMSGQQTSSAINGLKNIMAGVLKPTAEAKEQAKALGLEFDAAALRSKGLAGFLEEVMAKTGGSEEKFAKLFGSVEGLSSALLLTGGAADAFKSNLQQLSNAGGTVDRVLTRIGQTQADKFQKSWNKMLNTAIRFGQALSPVVSMIGDAFEKLASSLVGMDEGTLQFTAKLLGIVAVIGPTVVGIGKLISAFAQIKLAIGALSTLVGGGGVLAGIAVGLGAIIAGVVLLKQHMDSMSGTNKIKAAFGSITLDTGAIDTAIDEAEKTSYAMEVTATAELKLSTTSTDLHSQIVAWLTDGKTETKKQKEEYKTKAEEVIAPVYTAIQEAFDEKKTTLDQQLSGGIIDKATYDARLDELKTTTDATKTSLDNEAQAYITYVMTLAAQGTKPTEDQLAKLEELRQKIVDVGNSILEAQNIALQAAKASYTATAAGRGTTADVAKGVAYLKMDTEIQMGNVEQAHQQAMADLQTEWDKAETPELKTEIETKMELENTNYEDDKAKVEEEYSKRLSKMIAGLAKKYPEEVDKLVTVAGKQDLIERIQKTLTEALKAGPGGMDPVTDLYAELFPEEPVAAPDVSVPALEGYVDKLKGQVAETITGTDMTPIFTDFSTALSSGATEGLDVSQVGLTLSSLLTAFDLAPDGVTLMEKLVTGMTTGITDNQGDLNQAMIDAAIEGNNAFKKQEGIHSPSTVWLGFGINIMDGLLAGIESKRYALTEKMKDLAKAALKAAKDELGIESPSKEFAKLGRFSGEGMIKGMEEMRGRVQGSMRMMVQAPSASTARAATSSQSISTETNNFMSTLEGLFSGATVIIGDKLGAQGFAHEVLGVWNNQIRAVGGTP